MEQLQLREKEIFETLKKIKKRKFVVIGGYAVNAYTLPRFSVDFDIVIKDHAELEKIEGDLLSLDMKKRRALPKPLIMVNLSDMKKRLHKTLKLVLISL